MSTIQKLIENFKSDSFPLKFTYKETGLYKLDIAAYAELKNLVCMASFSLISDITCCGNMILGNLSIIDYNVELGTKIISNILKSTIHKDRLYSGDNMSTSQRIIDVLNCNLYRAGNMPKLYNILSILSTTVSSNLPGGRVNIISTQVEGKYYNEVLLASGFKKIGEFYNPNSRNTVNILQYVIPQSDTMCEKIGQ